MVLCSRLSVILDYWSTLKHKDEMQSVEYHNLESHSTKNNSFDSQNIAEIAFDSLSIFSFLSVCAVSYNR